MVTPNILEEYVFYYNYVTRGLALFHGFIAASVSEETTFGPPKGCEIP